MLPFANCDCLFDVLKPINALNYLNFLIFKTRNSNAFFGLAEIVIGTKVL